MDIFEEISKDLVQYLNDRKAVKEQKLDHSHGHVMLLISDLIEILGITTATEIIECLGEWGYQLNNKGLQKYLSLLKHLKLIKRKLNADQTYYVSGTSQALIRFDFVPGTKNRDRERIKRVIREGLSTNDERRMKVYRRDLANRSRGRLPHV